MVLYLGERGADALFVPDVWVTISCSRTRLQLGTARPASGDWRLIVEHLGLCGAGCEPVWLTRASPWRGVVTSSRKDVQRPAASALCNNGIQHTNDPSRVGRPA